MSLWADDSPNSISSLELSLISNFLPDISIECLIDISKLSISKIAFELFISFSSHKMSPTFIQRGQPKIWESLLMSLSYLSPRFVSRTRSTSTLQLCWAHFPRGSHLRWEGGSVSTLVSCSYSRLPHEWFPHGSTATGKYESSHEPTAHQNPALTSIYT